MPDRPPGEIVLCSLEPWTPVRRRLQLLVEELLGLLPDLRVLFVEPTVEMRTELCAGRWPAERSDGSYPVPEQVTVLRPRKWLPRSLGDPADRPVRRQVLTAAASIGFTDPLLWVNDPSYARLATAWDGPVVYDVTDDWTRFPMPPRVLRRLRRDDELLVGRADALVVCSPDLACTYRARRPVEVVPNAVDVAHFRTPRPRPDDLPAAPTAVYVGTLHDSRIDVALCVALARAGRELHVVLVGPDLLEERSRRALAAEPNIHLLGPRHYQAVPGYLQHADVIVIPHLVNAFTESLDPIKGYECLAVDRPTVTTPVAGLRDLAPQVLVAGSNDFPSAVAGALAAGPPVAHTGPPPPTWADRAATLATLMARVVQATPAGPPRAQTTRQRGPHRRG